MNNAPQQMTLEQIFSKGSDEYTNGNLIAAENLFRQVLQQCPDHPAVHFYLAQVLLAGGDYIQGWQEMAWRFKVKAADNRQFNVPIWQGEPLAGQTVLVHAEQGFGDNIQFVRYVPLLMDQGAQVIVGCKSGLKRLFSSLPGSPQIIEPGDQVAAFDYHVPLMSLPELFKTTVDTVPGNVPYLSAEPELVKVWADKLGPDEGFKVGICWSGNPEYPMNPVRSSGFQAFHTLMDLPGLRFYGLQLGDARKQADTRPETVNYQDLADDLMSGSDAFVVDAAVMANLDLVISSDTAVPHLAGALGCPVWCVLSHFADWRWLKNRGDSPWYPSMRLFRQPEPDDWKSVFDDVRLALQEKMSGL